ncbi:hypothetical protein CCZ01_08835 [Helicobacter monodelphidis]|uniref:RluA family pseudouridine synthase n=1 Tax=Helicobacter sp. 15-1451 TaxID=2004995 RepID=UPI000DCB2EBC|nr:RluA family pseudouridine synthase [Helicobacter sp. 15-1451]RAX56677.1 hypothetical protein CCZ01_08835 [Helicobacter sp. 15-1451]
MGFLQQKFFISSPTPAFLFLIKTFNISQKEAQRWIDKKRLRTANHHICKKGETLMGEVEITLFKPATTIEQPFFRTPFFTIFNKPANLLSHPKGCFESISMLDSIYAILGKNAVLTHRLDKETSGLLLVAHNAVIAKEIGYLFMNRLIHKTYLAWVEGYVKSTQTISLPLRKPKKEKDLSIRMQIAQKGEGKEAITSIYPLTYNQQTNSTLVRVIPKTGRTHQIRIHLATIGHRILGDPLYGIPDAHSRLYLESNLSCTDYEKYFGAKRLMLHAYGLEFPFRDSYFHLICPTNFDKKILPSK